MQALWQLRRFRRQVALIALVIMAAGCSAAIPPAEQFKNPAIGTPFSADVFPNASVLPTNTSGVLFVNRTTGPVQVAIDNSSIQITPGDSFLFILPPGTHRFFIYERDVNPKVHTEHTALGKIRYVYLFPLGQL
jgi:hypothetical protein